MIHICDNFFSDPYKVRSIALKEKYVTERFNYPGLRSFNVPKEVSDQILSYVRYLTKNSSLKLTSSSFQSIMQEFGDGIYHQDRAYDYLCMIYLSLDSPLNSGTEICGDDEDRPDHIWANWDGHGDKIRNLFHEDPFNLINRYRYGRIRKKINSYYKPNIIATNKFNRCVIFPSHNFHRAENFFGTSLENSRLTIVSFISEHQIGPLQSLR